MKRPPTVLPCLLLLLAAPSRGQAQPSPAALAAFHEAAARIEQTLPRRAGLVRAQAIEHLPERSPAGALLHHWRATAFAPGARAADFERLLRDFAAYPRRFAPEVLAARATPLGPDRYEASLRVRQKHVLTVVLDSTYDVTFGPGASTSHSQAVTELDARNHPVPDRGFLWCLNSYWRWTERDGGLYLSLETLSLSRDLPAGLGWALRPYIDSVPRESLEFTLRSALTALAEQGESR